MNVLFVICLIAGVLFTIMCLCEGSSSGMSEGEKAYLDSLKKEHGSNSVQYRKALSNQINHSSSSESSWFNDGQS